MALVGHIKGKSPSCIQKPKLQIRKIPKLQFPSCFSQVANGGNSQVAIPKLQINPSCISQVAKSKLQNRGNNSNEHSKLPLGGYLIQTLLQWDLYFLVCISSYIDTHGEFRKKSLKELIFGVDINPYLWYYVYTIKKGSDADVIKRIDY